MPKAPSERRLNPRLDHKLPLNMAVNGYDFATTTHNLSCVGAYCHIDKYVPPFTKISVKLNLPFKRSAKQANALIECKGVIVRSEDETKGGFNIAIFFNEIRSEQRKKLAQYIKQFLP